MELRGARSFARQKRDRLSTVPELLENGEGALLGGEAGAVAEPCCMVIAAVRDAAVGVPPGKVAALHSAKRAAGAVAEARLMVIAAVGDAAMDMPSGEGAALHGAKSAAVVVADAALVVIAAVGDAAVNVPSGRRAALRLADGDRPLDALAVASAAVMAVGGDRQRQKGQSQSAEQNPFDSHDGYLPKFCKEAYFYDSMGRPRWQDPIVQNFFKSLSVIFKFSGLY